MKNEALENRIKRLEKQNSDSKTILKLFNEWIESVWMHRNIRFVLFIAFLVMIYIVHTRNAEQVCSQISKYEKENKQLRWEYLLKKTEAEKFERRQKLNGMLLKNNLHLNNTDDIPHKLKTK